MLILKCFFTIAYSLPLPERILQIGPVVPEISAFKQTNSSAL
jgi:hypothetical protein